jgi:hypothetical protein
VLGIVVQRLLARAHAELPLEVLRDGSVERIARQQDDLLAVVVLLGVGVAGVVLQVVVVREEDARNRGILAVQVVEADQVVLRQVVPELVEAREQHPQPGPAALAEGHDHAVGELQLVEFLPATQPAFEADLPLGRHPETEAEDQEPRDLLDYRMHLI